MTRRRNKRIGKSHSILQFTSGRELATISSGRNGSQNKKTKSIEEITNMKAKRSKTLKLTNTAAFALCLAGLLAIPPRTQAQGNGRQKATIITFNAPHAGTSAYQGTNPASINPAGAIAGYYADSQNAIHGFLRAPDGSFTEFDAPGAVYGTFAYNINAEGAIAGIYLDASSLWHGFLRAPDGTFTRFEAPGAGTTTGQGTITASIDDLNPEGAIAGAYVDAGSTLTGTAVFQAFVRAPDGTFTDFSAAGAGTGPEQGTNVAGINPAGTIPGIYIDSSGVNHGYVRAADGTITEFDVSGAGAGSGQGTLPENINTPGDIDGYYIDGGGVGHGFLRTSDGAITTFDAPGAGTSSGQGTFPAQNNPSDAITGTYLDSSNLGHGFLRSPQGSITEFDVRGAGTGANQGTSPYGINPAGVITGIYVDSQNVYHGFLRVP
jgi:hypothetical protein